MSQTEPEKIKDAVKKHFSLDRHPEHVQESLEPILKLIQSEVQFTRDEWIDVFDGLQVTIEFGEVGWLEDSNE